MTPNSEKKVLNAEKIIILGTVDSTNNYAMARLRESAQDQVQAWQALRQTAGRGRMGKKWCQQSGMGLAISVGIPAEQLRGRTLVWFSMLLATVARQCTEDWLGIKGVVRIKWPNDLLIGDRKAGGMLLETVLSGQKLRYLVAGLGVNLNGPAHSGDLRNRAVSLQMVNGTEYSVTEAGEYFYNSLVQKLNDPPEWDRLFHEYQEHLYGKDKEISFYINATNDTLTGIMKGVNEEGEIGIETISGLKWWPHHLLSRKESSVTGT